jgi:stress response protein YsnF
MKSQNSSIPNKHANTKNKSSEIDEERIIPPKLPKEFIHIVRPANLDKEKSLISLTSKLANTVKDRADETINSIFQAASPSTDNDHSSKRKEGPDTPQISADAKQVHDVVSIEKKWVTKKTKIEIPVSYERVYVNDHELKFGVEEAVSEIKDRLLDTVSVERDKENNLEYNWVPLFGPDTDNQTEFPIYAEELVISKRKVMIGKVVIRKRQVIKQKAHPIN